MKPFFTVVVALAAILGFLPPAQACSLLPGYRSPTNFELVELADIIILGRVIGGASPTPASDGYILIEPLDAIKGDLPHGIVRLDGVSLGSALLGAEPSNPYELNEEHPEASSGACNRYTFELGRTVLFMLEKHGDALIPVSRPFSRWAEDIPWDQAPWFRAVKIYADAAALPQDDRAYFLAAERDRLLALAGDPDAGLIAIDIDRQLSKDNQVIEHLRDEWIEAYRNQFDEGAEADGDSLEEVEEVPG